MSFYKSLRRNFPDEMLAFKRKAAFSSISMCRISTEPTIKTIKRKIQTFDMKIQEQEKAVDSGFDMDILPSDLPLTARTPKAAEQIADPDERLFS